MLEQNRRATQIAVQNTTPSTMNWRIDCFHSFHAIRTSLFHKIHYFCLKAQFRKQSFNNFRFYLIQSIVCASVLGCRTYYVLWTRQRYMKLWRPTRITFSDQRDIVFVSNELEVMLHRVPTAHFHINICTYVMRYMYNTDGIVYKYLGVK